MSKSVYNIDDLIRLGRNMIDRSEKMNTTNEQASDRANNLCRIGDLLIRVGTPFGTKIEEFSGADGRFIMNELRKFSDKENVEST